MEYAEYLKFLGWLAERFGFLALLVIILVLGHGFLIWRVWKGLEAAMHEQAGAIRENTEATKALSSDTREMENSVLVSVLSLPSAMPEFKKEAGRRQAALNRRQS